MAWARAFATLVAGSMFTLCDSKLCHTDRCLENFFGWSDDPDCCAGIQAGGCRDDFRLTYDRETNGQTADVGSCLLNSGVCCEAPECSDSRCTSPDGQGGGHRVPW